METEMVKTAYTLLPPPLAAIPAKYWTSISLWLHSYTVARTFQILVNSYAEVREVDAPNDEEAFLIGFLHDVGQKLKMRRRPSEEQLVKWVRENLEEIGFTGGEADELSRYLYTNPAETLSDPLYDRSVWRLLWLADRLQGVDNPLAIVQLLEESKEDLGLGLNIILVNATIPQPLLRTLISKIVHDKIQNMLRNEGKLLIPITTPYGLAIIADEANLTLEIDWDEVRRGFDGNGILDERTEDDLKWDMDCCKKESCKKSCSTRNKDRPQECIDHRMSPDSCNKAIYLGKRASVYELTLTYYGLRERIQKDVVLPEDVSLMFQGIRLTRVKYGRGNGVCPICGMKTPSGVMADYLQFFIRGIATEQWTRKVFPGNLNTQIMRNPSRYPVDPLCLGEAILRARSNYQILISLTLRALTPLPVLEEVGKLLWSLLYVLETGIPRRTTIQSLVYGDASFEKTMSNIIKGAEVAKAPNFYYDAFTATIVAPYRNPMQRHQDEWLRDIIVSGVLAAWGLYPITISETVPSAPSNALLSYYKGRKPLYDYQPSDKNLGEYTPYVAATMMSLAELNYRKEVDKENLPALLEVLDYPPEHSPLLLQYGSPSLYSHLESLRVRIGVRL